MRRIDDVDAIGWHAVVLVAQRDGELFVGFDDQVFGDVDVDRHRCFVWQERDRSTGQSAVKVGRVGWGDTRPGNGVVDGGGAGQQSGPGDGELVLGHARRRVAFGLARRGDRRQRQIDVIVDDRHRAGIRRVDLRRLDRRRTADRIVAGDDCT